MPSPIDLLREKVFSKYQKDTWEIKTLGEIAAEIISGSEITREQLGTGDHPAIRFTEIFNSEIAIEKCEAFVNPVLIKNKKYAETGDILLASSSNIKKNLGKAAVYLGKEKCLAGNHVIVIKTDQNTKFLAYILSSSFAKTQIEKLAQKSTVYDLYPSKIKQIKIPLPSLEIQQEIVEFLDKFTELERELERRKQQYEYYRELLFNRGIEEQNWPLKTIGEIASQIYIGSHVTREQLGTGDHPAIKAGDINSSLGVHFKKCLSLIDQNLVKEPKYFECGDILFAKLSNKIETLGISAYLGEKRGILGDGVYTLKHNQNPKYLSYVLSSEYCKQQIKRRVQKGTVYHFYARDIKQIQIPLPPLEEQERVVEILDKLYRISHDFKEGIPLLIQKNREQYEYYRELLLSHIETN